MLQGGLLQLVKGCNFTQTFCNDALRYVVATPTQLCGKIKCAQSNFIHSKFHSLQSIGLSTLSFHKFHMCFPSLHNLSNYGLFLTIISKALLSPLYRQSQTRLLYVSKPFQKLPTDSYNLFFSHGIVDNCLSNQDNWQELRRHLTPITLRLCRYFSLSLLVFAPYFIVDTTTSSCNYFLTSKFTLLTPYVIFTAPKASKPSPHLFFLSSCGSQSLLKQLPKCINELTTSMSPPLTSISVWSATSLIPPPLSYFLSHTLSTSFSSWTFKTLAE